MRFIFAIKYDKNAVDLSSELKTSQKVGRIEGALVAKLISKINPLFAEVKKVGWMILEAIESLYLLKH